MTKHMFWFSTLFVCAKNHKISNKKMTQQEIAQAFSIGDFDLTYQYLSETIEWIVVGESHFKGKQEVVDNCDQTAAYFKSVTTNFLTKNIIASHNKVAINGTAEFIRDGKSINFVSACDVYEFNDNNELQTITSYCIQDKK